MHISKFIRNFAAKISLYTILNDNRFNQTKYTMKTKLFFICAFTLSLSLASCENVDGRGGTIPISKQHFPGIWCMPDKYNHVTRYFEFKDDGTYWDYILRTDGGDTGPLYTYYFNDYLCGFGEDNKFYIVSSALQGAYEYIPTTGVLICDGQEVGTMTWINENEVYCTSKDEFRDGKWCRAKGVKSYKRLVATATFSDSIAAKGAYYVATDNFSIGVTSNKVAGRFTENDFVKGHFSGIISGITKIMFAKAYFTSQPYEEDTTYYHLEGIFECVDSSLYGTFISFYIAQDLTGSEYYKTHELQVDFDNATVNGVHYDDETNKCWKVTITRTVMGFSADEVEYMYCTEFVLKYSCEGAMATVAAAGVGKST